MLLSLNSDEGDMSMATDHQASAETGGGDRSEQALSALVADVCRGLLDPPAHVAATRQHRDRICEVLGEAAMVDAAAVVGMFNGINQVADMVGVRCAYSSCTRITAPPPLLLLLLSLGQVV